MRHGNDSGAWGTYEDDMADTLALACLLIGALCVFALGFLAGWAAFG